MKILKDLYFREEIMANTLTKYAILQIIVCIMYERSNIASFIESGV